jgi:hypothetical protein
MAGAVKLVGRGVQTGKVVDIPASTVPAARITSTASKTRRLPIMSPSRPRIGVSTEAESK